MAKKFGKFLLGATLVAGAATAAYWYKKNYMDKDKDFDEFDELDDEDLDDFADYDGYADFDDDFTETNYVPIKLNQDETASAMDDFEDILEDDILDEDEFEETITEDDILDEASDEDLDALAEEALESLQDL